MVTMLVESGMYNKEAKEGFLNSIKNDEMRDKVYYSFLKSSIVEKKKDKDIYEMSLEELGEWHKTYHVHLHHLYINMC